MYRKQFENLVTPLTDKEINYKKNPNVINKLFNQALSLRDEEGIFHFKMISPNPAEAGLQFRDYRSTFMDKAYKLSNNIVFNRQSRYSLVPLHRHEYIEMNFIYSGNATAVINNQELQLTEGDICIMDSGVVHTLYTSTDNDIILNAIMDFQYFSNSLLLKLSDSGPIARFLFNALNKTNKHNQYMLFHTLEHPLVKELFENAYCEFLEPGICSAEAIDNYMQLLFIELVRCYQITMENEYKSSNKNHMTEILLHIEENCVDCTLESVAEKYHFHPNYLSRAIKKATGYTFKSLVSEYRMKLATFYLMNSDMPIHKIALDCGYKNLNFFYKKFYEYYHMSPKNYRDNNH
jgi:AraC-like DNA-binding protein/mannose-6-phosphate isomerase-like protein (cupin superfamily)